MNDQNSIERNQPASPSVHQIEPSRFRQSLKWVIVPPVVLMVLLAGVLLWQVQNLLNATRRVEHSDQIIAHASAVLTSMLNMETGQRGYLITGERQFLEPYNAAQTSIDLDFDDLSAAVAGNSSQMARLKEIEDLSQHWRTFAATTIVDREANKLAGIAKGDMTGKRIMDQIRAALNSFITNEARVRDDLTQQTRRAVLTTVWASGGLTLLLGLILALNARQQFIAIAGTYDRALKIAADEADARRGGELQLRQMADAMPPIVWIARADGFYEYYNQRWTEYTGRAVEQSLGQQWVDLLHPDDQQRATSRWQDALRSGEPYEVEYRLKRNSDGMYRWFMCRALSARDADGNILRWYGTCTDIHDRKLDAEARERYAQQLQDLAVASVGVNSAMSLEEAIHRVTEFARQIIGAHQSLSSFVTDSDWPHATNSVSVSDKYEKFRQQLSHQDGDGIHAIVCKSNRPVRMTQAELEVTPQWQQLAKKPPMRGWLAVPLIGGDGGNIGVIQLSDKIEGEFDADDEAILVQLAQMASIAIENAQYFKATQQARLEAENANRLKDQFLATLSHELRTPLNAILGWAQLLRRMDLSSEEGKQGLETIERNAKAQTQLIEDLLDVSRIISGKLRLDVQSVNLQEVIAASLDAVEPATMAKSLRIERLIDPAAGPVSGDPARLQQVLWNLLSNAVKFTPRGGKVQVKLSRVNSHVEIAITDTGEGIGEEFLPHMFYRFSQADGTTTRTHGGLGLGLSIVKHLVEMHGGSVRAASEGKGKGSSFIVSLPISVAHEPAGQRAHPTTSNYTAGSGETLPDLQGLRVLVVDDESDARDLIRRILASGKAEVVAVGSAREALAMMQPFKPQVLISDIGMPDVDGYDFIRQIRAGGQSSREIPAVALTAFARTEDRRRALMAGFQIHVAKPVDPSELLAVVASLAGRTNAQGPA